MKRILLIAVGAGLLVLAPALFTCGLIQFILPQTYLSVARISVPEPRSAGGIPAAKNPLWIPTQIEIIQSKMVLSKVVEQLHLNREWAKRYKEASDLRTELTCLILKSMLSVRQTPQTSLIEIRVVSEKPSEAAQIANTIAEVFRENRTEVERSRLQSTSTTSLPVVDNATVEIIDAAVPGFRPARPTTLTKVSFFAGSLLSGVLGLAVLLLGLRKAKSV